MNVRQVRKKIRSITNVKKITKAMELISGIKMRKAQEREIQGRPYRDLLSAIVDRVSAGLEGTSSPLLFSRPGTGQKRPLVIFVTSNKGLCGSFNVNLQRYLLDNFNLKENDFIAVGKKGALMLGRTGSKIIADFSSTNALNQVSAIFSVALERFLGRLNDEVILVYTRFISTLKSEITRELLLPVSFVKMEKLDEEGQIKTTTQFEQYLIEPSPEELIDPLLRSFVEEKIRGALISSEAVEHSARMIAMKNATDNANDVIYNFTLLANKLRQEKITNELLDMMTAKESVES